MRSASFKLAIALLLCTCVAWAAPPRFSVQTRVGLHTGDQWEPALAADSFGHLYVLYPQYGNVPGCKECAVPTMLLVVSNDNGKTWMAPRVLLGSGSAQFDPQIVVDPADRRTVYAAWLQRHRRDVMVAKSIDAGATWTFTMAARGQGELDKPALAVRGRSVYVAFNHEQDIWVAASQDGGSSFAPIRVNADSAGKDAGWSLLGGATVDPSGEAHLAWAAYSKAGGAHDGVQLFVANSEDGGKSWSRTLVDVSAAAPECASYECSEAFLGAQIALASDAGGTLYALWTAGSRRLGPQKVFFSASTDGGESWLPRMSLSIASVGIEHAFPAIVAGGAGDVRVAWMDSRHSPYWNTFYRSSTNGGATWSEETRVSGYVPGYRYITKQGFRFPFGDYFGIAIDNQQDTQLVWGEGMNYQSPGSIWHASGR